ncbi:hypothetical protein DASC09_001920 [Saccharomycopsis crataegensis]|uniref:Uncharacterized protein n=1 Tax=Saccharomycopsis crataegensis TaxID=43959 RepID=A0AAV5QE04_9ASCO|nr:hypothetical protein DASC09_001920 [Saccharomycopsis crataegensis]
MSSNSNDNFQSTSQNDEQKKLKSWLQFHDNIDIQTKEILGKSTRSRLIRARSLQQKYSEESNLDTLPTGKHKKVAMSSSFCPKTTCDGSKLEVNDFRYDPLKFHYYNQVTQKFKNQDTTLHSGEDCNEIDLFEVRPSIGKFN